MSAAIDGSASFQRGTVKEAIFDDKRASVEAETGEMAFELLFEKPETGPTNPYQDSQKPGHMEEVFGPERLSSPFENADDSTISGVVSRVLFADAPVEEAAAPVSRLKIEQKPIEFLERHSSPVETRPQSPFSNCNFDFVRARPL